MYTKCGAGARTPSWRGCAAAAAATCEPLLTLSSPPRASHSEDSANSLSHPHRRLYTGIPNHRHRNGGTGTGLRR
ncbi:hypothetical protein DAI22_01g043700 [Oryza sativa Japonica Group]|nr:hypothetical protein DAI22_01g043700 [Oryza sativa Japonica Group]